MLKYGRDRFGFHPKSHKTGRSNRFVTLEINLNIYFMFQSNYQKQYLHVYLLQLQRLIPHASDQ